MNTIVWLLGGAVALFLGWWALRIFLSVSVSPEVSGRTYLKQALKQRGVDVARIPDSAINEIVQFCLKGARGMAAMNRLSSHGRTEDKNWRANLVRQLDAHIPIIQSIMAGGQPSLMDDTIREILIRNGVVHS